MNGHKLSHILPELHVLKAAVHELTLSLVGFAIRSLGRGWDIPVLDFFALARGHDSILVGCAESTVHVDAITPGIEARGVPAHLSNKAGSLCVLV